MSRQQVGKTIIYEDVQPVTRPTLQGEIIEAGQLVTRQFEGERVMTHEFETVDGDKYRIRPTTEAFRVVDHTEALTPIIEAGYKITRMVAAKGGTDLITYFEPANPTSFDDPIHWDHDLWANYTGDHKLNEMLIAKTTVRPGKRLSFERGLLRLVCTNGLVSGFITNQMRVRHADFDGEDLVEELIGLTAFDRQMELLGPEIGNVNGVDRFIRFLQRIDRENRREDELPYFARELTGGLVRSPSWWLDSYEANLIAMRDNINRPVHLLDLVNAVTSPISMELARPEEERRSVARSMSRTRSLTDASSKLISIFSLS